MLIFFTLNWMNRFAILISGKYALEHVQYPGNKFITYTNFNNRTLQLSAGISCVRARV